MMKTINEMPLVDEVKTAEEARDLAIEWQLAVLSDGDDGVSWGEIAEWQDYFEKLAVKFPELADEFAENAITGWSV